MINQVKAAARTSFRRLQSKKGQSLLEYALVLAFISVIAATYMTSLSDQIRSLYLSILSTLSAAGHGF